MYRLSLWLNLQPGGVSAMKKGFTMVEIIMAIGLVTVMSGAILAQYIRYNQQRTAQTTAERLAQVFAEARTNAEGGKIDCNICGGVNNICDNQNDAVFLGWRVSMITAHGANGYEIEGECFDSSHGTLTFMNRTEQFPTTALISSPNGTQVLFKPLNGGTDLTSSMYLSVQGSDGTQSGFYVTPAGEIISVPNGTYTCMVPGTKMCLPAHCGGSYSHNYPSGGTCPSGFLCCN